MEGLICIIGESQGFERDLPSSGCWVCSCQLHQLGDSLCMMGEWCSMTFRMDFSKIKFRHCLEFHTKVCYWIMQGCWGGFADGFGKQFLVGCKWKGDEECKASFQGHRVATRLQEDTFSHGLWRESGLGVWGMDFCRRSCHRSTVHAYFFQCCAKTVYMLHFWSIPWIICRWLMPRMLEMCTLLPRHRKRFTQILVRYSYPTKVHTRLLSAHFMS